MAKEWFVILWQGEFEAMNTVNQLVVYAAIKSYSANGKNEVDISIRDIARRSKLSVGEIHKTIHQLIELGFIQIIGQKARRGGSVPIYKVFTPQTLNPNKRSQGEQLNDESVHLSDLSVHNPDTKYIQSKKENKENYFKNPNIKKIPTHIDNWEELDPGDYHSSDMWTVVRVEVGQKTVKHLSDAEYEKAYP